MVKMFRDPRSFRLVRERKLFDWTFHPAVCWTQVSLLLFRHLFLRYLLRRRRKSFYALLEAQGFLLKVSDRPGAVWKLKQAVARTIGREISRGGPELFHLPGEEQGVDQDLPFILRNGGIVLKPPRLRGPQVLERGVLMLNHARSFQIFSLRTNVPDVLRHYALILETGWSGYTDPAILYFTRFRNQPILVLAPERRDYDFLKALNTNLIPVPLGCSEWVNPSTFYPLPGRDKVYDVVFVASWLMFKRHHILFRALHRIKDSSFRVALVSHSPQRRDEIERLAGYYGVVNNLAFFEGLSQEALNRVFNQSKVNLLLSLREGGNRALFEGFMSGVPGLALKDQIGIPKDYFTPETGRLISEKDLISELLYFKDHWSGFDPRPWAEAHLSPEASTAKLNELLKEIALQRGEEWTRDIVAKCNGPNFRYYPSEKVGEGMPAYGDILEQYARIVKDRS